MKVLGCYKFRLIKTFLSIFPSAFTYCVAKLWVICKYFDDSWIAKVSEGRLVSLLKSYNKSPKVHGSNSTRHSTHLKDPTSHRSFRWPSGRNCKNAVINIGIGWVRLSPWWCTKVKKYWKTAKKQERKRVAIHWLNRLPYYKPYYKNVN